MNFEQPFTATAAAPCLVYARIDLSRLVVELVSSVRLTWIAATQTALETALENEGIMVHDIPTAANEFCNGATLVVVSGPASLLCLAHVTDWRAGVAALRSYFETTKELRSARIGYQDRAEGIFRQVHPAPDIESGNALFADMRAGIAWLTETLKNHPKSGL